MASGEKSGEHDAKLSRCKSASSLISWRQAHESKRFGRRSDVVDPYNGKGAKRWQPQKSYRKEDNKEMSMSTALPEGAKVKLSVVKGLRPGKNYTLKEGVTYIGRKGPTNVDIDLTEQE